MKVQNKNFLYNLIYQVLIYIIPLIITPYISRVLGVNNVGIYSYTYSIVYYFMLASMLGISNYGSREIAKCKTDRETGILFKSLHTLQVTLNLICVIIYFLLAFFVYDYRQIMLIQGIQLISVAFDVNWYFWGKENFKITISRNIIIKLLSLILIFLFVKDKNDLWIYTLIMSASTLVSQLYLWIFIPKDFEKENICPRLVFQHLKPCFILFIPVISYSIYRVMDKTMIGFISNTIELGNYDSAEKIINIPISFITALGTVMMPHMAKKSEMEIKHSIYDTFEMSFFIACPMVVGLFVIAHDFSNVFFGTEFAKTGIIIRCLVTTIVFSAISNVVRTNFLIPLKKDSVYVLSTVIGAVVNLICNSIFIVRFGAYGACIGTIAAEFTLMLYQVVNTRQDINYHIVGKLFAKYFLKSLAMGLAIYMLVFIAKDILLRIMIQLCVAGFVYFVLCKSYIFHGFFGSD